MTRLSLPYQGFLVKVFSVTLNNLVATLILKAESLTIIISFRDKELEVCMLTCGPVKKNYSSSEENDMKYKTR